MYPEHTYLIVVGNVGTVLATANAAEARREFGQWKAMSKAPYGRASGEPVTLLCDGEIENEYQPEEGIS